MKTITIIVLVAVVLIVGFVYLNSNKKPHEPTGTPVALTAEDRSSVNWADDNAKTWAAWHTKGTRLVNEGKHDEALYSFQQALVAYPKELSSTAPEASRKSWKEVPTDTYLQLGYLYQKMNKRDLALYYFEKFDSYIPNNQSVKEEIQKLKQK
ncbi:MAG TPA: tetratricopeptide repeat protein [Verrucomicrobiae bacterium]|nr:tetratricopeptide repeat protein [Verrucomicrobiae bacterium]